MVEMFFDIITRQAIRRGTYRSVKDLTAKIGEFIDGWNERCHSFRIDQVSRKTGAASWWIESRSINRRSYAIESCRATRSMKRGRVKFLLHHGSACS